MYKMNSTYEGGEVAFFIFTISADIQEEEIDSSILYSVASITSTYTDRSTGNPIDTVHINYEN